MPKVSLIIVHWNTPENLKNQLQKITNDKSLQVIVVDNHSKKSLDWLKKDFPTVELIKNNDNRGYASACNQGIGKADADWLLFLNPDVEIDKASVSKMIFSANLNKYDACSPIGGNNYQKPLPSWLNLLVEFTPLNKLYDFKSFTSSKTLFGGCLLIKKSVIKKLGGWDERFFLWFEDSDLTHRLIKNNYKTGFLQLTIKHSGGIAFQLLNDQQKKDIFFHSMSVFSQKHFSFWGKFIVNILRKKYSKKKLLPEISNKISITVPNKSIEILNNFFRQNFTPFVFKIKEEWIIVTSAINSSQIWQWRKKYPSIRFILIEKNIGFANTVNIGFQASNGRWIATVNDDTLLNDTWTDSCLDCTDNAIGSVNPIIYDQAGKIETAGISIFTSGKAIKNHIFTSDRGQKCDFLETQATNAAAVFYSKKALNKVGLFDEKFGSYLEDIDLSLRLTGAGYKNIVSTKTSIVHFGQQTSASLGTKKQYLDFQNWIYVILKNWGIKKIILNFPAIFIERLRNLSGVIKSFF